MSRAACLLSLLAACVSCKARSSGTGPTVSVASTPASATQTPTATASLPSTSATATTFARTFDDDAVDLAPNGFTFGRTGGGALGRWIVVAQPGAPSGPHVLAQLDGDATDHRFPVAVMNAPSLRDARVSVRCRTVAGQVDQACGLVARYSDENNYYVTRANALEDDVRLYTVRNGQRQQLASWTGLVAPKVWHALQLELRANHLEVFWDGKRVIDFHDSTFTGPGRVGVWTKADSVTHFDDLRVDAL